MSLLQRILTYKKTLVATAGVLCMMSSDRVQAFQDTGFELVSYSTPQSDVIDYSNLGSPFGDIAQKRSDTSGFSKWHTVHARMQNQMRDPQFDATRQAWKASLRDMTELGTLEKIRKVNSLVNQGRFVKDSAQFGQKDYWASPLEFFDRGAGDCEDYALAKMYSLRALGLPSDAMRLSVVFDTQKQIPHAILVVYDDEQRPWVLDNQNKNIISADRATDRYQPIYSLAQSAWWRHYQ